MIDNSRISSDDNGTSTGIKRMRDSTTRKSSTHTKGGKEQASRIDNNFQGNNKQFFFIHNIKTNFGVKLLTYNCNNVENAHNEERMQGI